MQTEIEDLESARYWNFEASLARLFCASNQVLGPYDQFLAGCVQDHGRAALTGLLREWDRCYQAGVAGSDLENILLHGVLCERLMWHRLWWPVVS